MLEISNRFVDLEESDRAEEIVNRNEQAQEARVRDSWDQAARNTDMANRKQQWQANKRRKMDNHPVGSAWFARSQAEGSSPSGNMRKGAEHSAHPFGSSKFSTKGPKAAGGP
eukprot:16451360-Heterocapsa_arctica.AAC.1